MLIACKCLNVTISTSESNNESPQRFNLDNLQKQQNSKIVSDHFQFFKEALGPLSNVWISKEIDSLVQSITIEGEWKLNRCINCKTLVYATNVNDISYLISSALLTNQEEVKKLKFNDNYSPIFGILVNANTLDFTDYYGKNIKASVIESPAGKLLTQKVVEFMQNETAAADDRIFRYTEQEFAVLKIIRERAEQECQILMNTINDVPEQINKSNIDDNNESDLMSNNKIITNETQLETPPATPEYIPMSTGNSPPLTKHQQDVAQHQPTSIKMKNLVYNNNNNNNINQKGAINKQHSSTNNHNHAKLSTDSFDSDCIFDIDGMDNDKSPLSNNLSDDEDCGFEETSRKASDDGIYIPRQLGRQSSIAKSLPITMPAIMSQFRTTEDDFEEMNEDNVDIAASIKALAKSVHGDTVFGDLPRPRFSTQI